jgi:FKBP-type peptidyl-prolyl cis-trans isomerase (trigger factor)
VHKHKVTVTDEMVNDEIGRLQTRNGNMTEPETVASEDNVLNLQFTETDGGRLMRWKAVLLKKTHCS